MMDNFDRSLQVSNKINFFTIFINILVYLFLFKSLPHEFVNFKMGLIYRFLNF